MRAAPHGFQGEIDHLVKRGKIPPFVAEILRKFYESYAKAALENGYLMEEIEPWLLQLLHFTVKQISHPYRFEPYHKRVVAPFDYYKFGLDFIRPLIDTKRSKVLGSKIFDLVSQQLAKRENVIFLANHQIEPDPQVISLLLEPTHPRLAEEMIFVAGHRVIIDPLAVPFSLGRNLLCIYSKKHLEHPPEQKAEKLIHNQRTMKKMVQLLREGGKCIYVAPSGGRDRPDEMATLRPAKFDPQSIDMFLLMAKQAKTCTHFYPMTLATYHILPPPNTVEKEVGEKREAKSGPVFMHLDQEVDLEAIVLEIKDKRERRQRRAEILSELIQKNYALLEAEELN